MKKIINLSILFVFFAILSIGVVWAVTGAGIQTSYQDRWILNPTESIVTQGGNVTSLNLTVNDSTIKWAAFYGNVSGNIILSDNTTLNSVFNWTWSAGSNNETWPGEVCASEHAGYIFSNMQSATAGNIDTAWSFQTSDTDSATNTFYNGTCNVTLFSVTSSGNAAKTGLRNSIIIGTGNRTTYDPYRTCPVANALGSSNKNTYLFCSKLIGNLTDPANGSNTIFPRNFKNMSVNFEVMAPVGVSQTSTITVETYYFYVKLK